MSVIAVESPGDETVVMRSNSRRRIVLIGFNGMQLLDLIGPADLFEAATRLTGSGGYEVTVASESGEPIRGSSGLTIGASQPVAHVRGRGIDTVIVGGGMNFEDFVANPGLNHHLQRLSNSVRRRCSVCTGAFLLAEAGLLDGKRATTHWAFCEPFQERYPKVQVEPDQIFVRDRSVYTAAGVTAGMDLALALIEEDHGPIIARSVARWSVMFLQRPGGQSQFSERLAVPASVGPTIRTILDEIVADPSADHRLGRLANRAAMSDRHLHRVFKAETSTTPARFVERVRVEAARELLEGTPATIDGVALQCGFGTPETMRRAFLRTLGVAPSAYRERFRSTEGQVAA